MSSPSSERSEKNTIWGTSLKKKITVGQCWLVFTRFEALLIGWLDPSLEDITVEGVAFARSLISDLALDVLLYQSSYRKQISKIVLNECNRIFRLYKERNPEFKGKVHVMGHSLGSAILFDILCRQQSPRHPDNSRNSLRFWASQGRPSPTRSKTKDHDMTLDFEAEDFYCLGSPIGLFQMLEGR